MEIDDIDVSNFVDVNRYNKDMKSIDNISSDISDMLDATVKTSSIVEKGINVNNLSDILEYLNNVIPIIQKSNISSNKKLLASLEDTHKELLKNKIIGAELKNSSSITAPLVAILSDILKQLKEEKKLDINIPESNITVSPTPITVEAPIVNVPAPIVNVPAPIVNIPESPAPIVNIDLDKLTKALEEYLKPIIYNTEINPLAVRLSDGDKWIDELKVLTGKIAEQAQYIPNSMFIKGEGGGTITPATEGSLNQLTGKFAILKDDVSTTGVTYFGKAEIGSSQNSSVWQIMKIDKTGSPITMAITFADGNAKYDNIFSNRLSLTYS